jgi:hypothetical protein
VTAVYQESYFQHPVPKQKSPRGVNHEGFPCMITPWGVAVFFART